MKPGEPSVAAGERAVAHMLELSSDVRGCAVTDRSGAVLAASGDPLRWTVAASVFLEAADAAAGEGEQGARASQAHVGTEEGEAFAVRFGELAMVAVAERFTLASLVLFDMRTILRDLAAGEVVDRRAPGAPPAAGARAA